MGSLASNRSPLFFSLSLSTIPLAMSIDWVKRFGCCTLLVLLLLLQLYRSESEEVVVSVDVLATKELISTGKHRFLDVRTVEEFNKGHLENALNVPYIFFTNEGMEKNPEFLDKVSSVLDKEDRIIVGCQHGVRSIKASEELLKAGFNHVKNMAGGYASRVQCGCLTKKHEEP